ncbi:hypothetical protein Pta02_64740 [Planobispora takensis]|uniref:Uncharacterized protein n=1 Tax=Planobispora takensis TaxID=1367882 RepID=A0A8J3WW47_9ACTN|nr:hypothetical protein Pta02_64740 [Planobispora takensis]
MTVIASPPTGRIGRTGACGMVATGWGYMAVLVVGRGAAFPGALPSEKGKAALCTIYGFSY